MNGFALFSIGEPVSEPDAVTTAIVCAGCGQQGTVEWVTDKGQRSPVGVSGGFYLKVSQPIFSGPSSVICGKCRKVHKP